MSVIAIPKPLREKLGEEATDAFVEVIKELEIDSHRGLATKDDIALLKNDIVNLREELKEDIANLRGELKEDIAKLTERVITVESELKFIKWMMGIILAGVISLVLKTFII